MKKITAFLSIKKSILAAAAVIGMTSTAFAGDIPDAKNTKAGEIWRHETATDINELLTPENGVYGVHTYAIDNNDWDSQFFIVFSDKVVPAGTVISIRFDYRKTDDSGIVKFNAQGHADPHAYVNNDGWETLEATYEWQTYTKEIESTENADGKGIRSFGVNASIGRDNGTLLLRNIEIAVNYEVTVQTQKTKADNADIEARVDYEKTAPTATVPYDKLFADVDTTSAALANSYFHGCVWNKAENHRFVPKTIKYGNDNVLAFEVSQDCPEPWNVQFFAYWTLESQPETQSTAVLSFDYKADIDYAVSWNVSHINMETGAGNQDVHWGCILPTSEWQHYEDTITDNWCWELHLGAAYPDVTYNVFLKDVVVKVDGKPVASLNDLTSVVGAEITEKLLTFKYADFKKNELIKYNGDGGHVVIPNSVVTIGANAFKGCTNINSIYIPESVKTIDNNAFANCINLINVTGGDNLQSIGEMAFGGCHHLKNISLPNTVKTIGTDAFLYVKNVEYHGNAKGKPWGALTVNGYTDDNFVYSNEEQTRLTAFIGDESNVTIPDGVVYIGSMAFFESKDLTTVEIPSTVQNIGNMTFANCTNLKKVNIPQSVILLGSSVFRDCPDAEIEIEYNCAPYTWSERWDYKLIEEQIHWGNVSAPLPVSIADETAMQTSVFVHGRTILIENATAEIRVYDAMGRMICRDAINRVRAEIPVNTAGVYIVRVGNVAKRVMINE